MDNHFLLELPGYGAPRTVQFGACLAKLGVAPTRRQEGAFHIHCAAKTP